jgi:hypothetical protein
MLKVSAMRIPLTVILLAIAMLASPLAYGQARRSLESGAVRGAFDIEGSVVKPNPAKLPPAS